jgi:hypothetical protein
MDKKHDCVEMKHKAATTTHNKLQGLSVAEKLSFWDAKYRRMSKRCRELQAK